MPETWKLGVVSYLNAKPLIAGLDSDPRIELIFDVPARLADMLDRAEVDAALVPVIDLLHERRDWHIISDACIGCDGETLTVRVFSKLSPDRIQTLHVDGDSHTSVALARIIWHEQFNRELTLRPYAGPDTVADDEGVLLIGDKVVTNRLIGFDVETDLGLAWKSLTTLPFVFAVWAAPARLAAESAELGPILSRARDTGLATADLIAADFGPGLGWPVALAKRYLTSRLKYVLGPKQRRGIERFLELAKRHRLIPQSKELSFA